ncbi:MAG: tyrosine-type recombinase/integrase [Christensenellales bacterium]|jgi:integrase/recombinase XerC
MSKKRKAEINIKKTEKLRRVLSTLPPFCLDYFRGIEQNTSLLTRINYAYDLRLFFSFLENELGEDVSRMSAKDLQDITLTDFEIFFEYLTLYYKDDIVVENTEKGIARKLASIRSFYKYYYKKEIIDTNVTTKLETPKIHEKPIIRLTNEETIKLFNVIETGSGMSPTQLAFHNKTKIRDMAIFTLFLTTGIRISELCALNISDFDFGNSSFKVIRKGGNEVLLYFGQETKRALYDYIEERKSNACYSLDSPMFLSLQNKRISVRALQQLVKKYAKIAVPLKNISPHKLRSTYGTMLYNETGDIYLVADVLGHKDVNTTRKHYAAIDEERRKRASGAVRFRDNS